MATDALYDDIVDAVLECVAREYGGAMRKIIANFRERGESAHFTIGWDDIDGTYPQVWTLIDCSGDERSFAELAATAVVEYARENEKETSLLHETLYVDCND